MSDARGPLARLHAITTAYLPFLKPRLLRVSLILPLENFALAALELLGLDRPPYVMPEVTCSTEQLASRARGVKWRGIYDRRSLDQPGKLDVMHRLAAAAKKRGSTATFR